MRDELSTIGRHRLTIQGLAFSSAGAIAAAFPWSIDFRTGSAFGTYTYASIYTGGSAAAFTVLKTKGIHRESHCFTHPKALLPVALSAKLSKGESRVSTSCYRSRLYNGLRDWRIWSFLSLDSQVDAVIEELAYGSMGCHQSRGA